MSHDLSVHLALEQAADAKIAALDKSDPLTKPGGYPPSTSGGVRPINAQRSAEMRDVAKAAGGCSKT